MKNNNYGLVAGSSISSPLSDDMFFKMQEIKEEKQNLKMKQEKEAIRRMKYLNLLDDVIKLFKEDDELYYSEQTGILYFLKDEWKKYVEDFEKKWSAKVYFVIHTKTDFGELLSMLYVSKNIDEWELDFDDLKNNCAVAYVENLDASVYSELGSIGIKSLIGGLIRTA